MRAIETISGGLSGGVSASIAGGNFWQGTRQGLITSGLNHGVNHLAAKISKRQLFKKAMDYAASHLGEERGEYYHFKEEFGDFYPAISSRKHKGYSLGGRYKFRMNFTLNGEKIRFGVEYFTHRKANKNYIIASQVLAKGVPQPDNDYYSSEAGRLYMGRGSSNGISGYGIEFKWNDTPYDVSYRYSPNVMKFHILETPETGLRQMNLIMEYFDKNTSINWKD